MKTTIVSLATIALLAAGSSSYAQDENQQIGTPLNLDGVAIELAYSNDFSGDDKIDRERAMVADGKRVRGPAQDAEWIAEGWGGADVCGGKLWVAPVAFKSCGQTVERTGIEPSHMVVWNKDQYIGDMMVEWTVNHHGSDDGLTLVFFSATGMEGQDIFNLDLPVRDGVYKTYNRGLNNYTVSYWSRNKSKGAVRKGEQYSNRVRMNPGMNMLATNDSLTDKCNNCDFKLRILKADGYITVEVNGKVVNHVKATPMYEGGYIGLRSMQGVKMVSYDDFKVWSVQ